MMTSDTTHTSNGEEGSIKRSTRRGRIPAFLLSAPRFHLALIAILLVTLAGFAIWRAASVYGLEREIATNEQRAHEAMVAQSGELLQLTAMPLAWAIRGDVLAGKTSDIDAYMDKLVREKYVKRIVFVDSTGRVVASTNAKLKDQPGATALPGVELLATEPRVERSGSDLRIVVPVMSFERQIGTLVLDYATEQAIDAKLPR